MISPPDFPIFPLIYIYGAFLFISSFGGDGRGGGYGELVNKKTLPKMGRQFHVALRTSLRGHIHSVVLESL